MPSAEPIIEVRGLVKEFGSAAKVQALREVHLSVSAGEFVAVMGASGSGKSTLLHLLAGLDEPTAASIRIVGVDLATLSEDQRARMRRNRLGLVFQAFHLLGTLTAEENVLLPLSIQGTTGSRARKRAKAALERVGLLHRCRHLPEALSGGEKQRAAIAQALVIEPVILLADEPTGNLDSEQGGRIMDLLRGLVDEQGQTLLLVTHDPAQARSTLLAAEQGLVALGAVALVTAGFVIFNTFLLNLSERRQQLALLKTLGATRGQLLSLLLGEALLLGIVSTFAGCGAGVGLAWLLVKTMGRFMGVRPAGLPLTAGPFLLGVLLGPAMPVLAACLPVWHASRRGPLAGLQGVAGDGDLSGWWIGVPGLLLLALGSMAAVGLCGGGASAAAGKMLLPVTHVMLLAGCTLCLPVVLGVVFRLLRAAPLGLLGRLAVQQLERHRSRTGLTAGVLFLALAVSAGFGQSLGGILHDLRQWYRQTIVADFLVRASMPDASFSLSPALPDSLQEKLAAVPSVERVERIAFLPAVAAGQDVLVLARTVSTSGSLPLDLRDGTPEEVRQGLLNGEAVPASGLAERLGLHRGDRIVLNTPRGPVSLVIAGTAAEFAGGGAALYLEWQTARVLLDVAGPHVFLVSARRGEERTAGEALQALCIEEHLLLQSNAELRNEINGLFERVRGAIWAVLVLVFVVASLGIVNTLYLSIHEQLRTFAVLRALGLRGGQIGRLVLMEALMLAELVLVPGSATGTALAYLISRGSTAWAGVPITFRADPAVIVGCSAIALLAALLSAVVPARKAARMIVREGLA